MSLRNINQAIHKNKFGAYYCDCGESCISDFPYNCLLCLTCGDILFRISFMTKKHFALLARNQRDAIKRNMK